MNKRSLHHLWVRIRPISYWYFLLWFIVFGVIGVMAFRQNNLTMISLRNAVYEADEKNGDVESALRDLREHVYGHMNTSLTSGDTAIRPPIQLKYRYERLLAEANENANGDLYAQAQADCERRFPEGLSGSNRLPCIEQYLDANGGAVAKPIPKELYQFDFVSPRWSFDKAGWSFILAGIFGLLFAVRYISELWLRNKIHEHA